MVNYKRRAAIEAEVTKEINCYGRNSDSIASRAAQSIDIMLKVDEERQAGADRVRANKELASSLSFGILFGFILGYAAACAVVFL